MAYGSIKVDNIVFTNGGVDQTVTVSGIVQSISGDITATGTIQGATIIGTSTVSGATVTGDAGQFITATAATGVFTSTLSGATITGNTASFTTITGGTVTLTSGVFASGTAAAPSVSVGTTDNGLYSPGTDQVAISTNGTGRLFVDADGRVVSEIAGIVDQDRFSTSNRIAYFRTSLNAGNQFGQIAIKGFHGAGINFLRGGTGGETNSAGIFSDASDNLRFTSGGATERLRITSDGKLGLGTSSPVTTLHLQKPTGGLAGVQISTSVHGSTLTDGLFVGIDNSIAYLYNYENLPLIFGTNSTERLRLTSDGKLGLGTSSPSQKLQIAAGNVQIDSNYGFIWDNSTTGIFGNGSPSFLQFYTGNAERARIDSSGRLLVGTSSVLAGTNLSAQFGTANTSGSITSISVGESHRIFHGHVPQSDSSNKTTTATFQFAAAYGAALIEIDIVGGLAQVSLGRYLLMVDCDTASGQTAQLTGGSSISAVLSSGWNAPVFTASGASSTPTFTVAFTRATGVDTENWNGYLKFTAKITSNNYSSVCTLTTLATS